MTRLIFTLMVLTGIFISGCAQKVTVRALQPAQFDKAASAKVIGVAPFDRDDVGLGAKIESGLADYSLKPGQGYFTVVARTDLDRVLNEQALSHSGLADDSAVAQLGRLIGAQALVSGSVHAASASDRSYRENRTRCAASDKKGKCLKTERYTVWCTKRSFTLSASARMVSVENGDLLAAKNLTQNSTASHCRDESGGLLSKSEGLNRLADRAAAEFISAITPSYIRFQVVLIDDLDVRLPGEHEQRFEAALAFIKENRLDRGKELLSGLMDATGGQSYAVAYNLGVLCEAEGDYDEAKSLYHQADRLTLKPVKPINEAIVRIDAVAAKHNRALKQMAR